MKVEIQHTETYEIQLKQCFGMGVGKIYTVHSYGKRKKKNMKSKNSFSSQGARKNKPKTTERRNSYKLEWKYVK